MIYRLSRETPRDGSLTFLSHSSDILVFHTKQLEPQQVKRKQTKHVGPIYFTCWPIHRIHAYGHSVFMNVYKCNRKVICSWHGSEGCATLQHICVFNSPMSCCLLRKTPVQCFPSIEYCTAYHAYRPYFHIFLHFVWWKIFISNSDFSVDNQRKVTVEMVHLGWVLIYWWTRFWNSCIRLRVSVHKYNCNGVANIQTEGTYESF